MQAETRRIVLSAAVVAGIVGCDQLTKYLAGLFLCSRGMVRVLGDVLILTYAENSGGFLGLGSAWHPAARVAVFGGLSLLVLACLAGFILRRRQLGLPGSAMLSLILGGGLGNVLDRLFRQGYVRDFVNVGVGRLRTGVFNLADLCLMAGVIWAVLAQLVPMRKTR